MPQHSQASTLFPAETLRDFARRVFVKLEIPANDAVQAADVLIASDLRGIDSHGVARLKAYYDMFRHGLINPRPNIRVVRQTPSTATVDGDKGLGLVVGPAANAIAMDKAAAVGTGWVAVRNSNHFGIAGYYPLQALSREMIGWAMTNSNAMVTPLGGAERKLGTNPIAIAFPAEREPPLVVDMATSVVPFGKIEMARRKGESIPVGWGVDGQGNPTTDPDQIVSDGAILPMGSDLLHGGHKGYCLSAMVDMLSAVLSGSDWGPHVVPFAMPRQTGERRHGNGVGHFFGAMRIDAFIEPAEFRARADAWIREMRGARPVPGGSGPLIPGDPERAAEAIRSKEGVPLLPAVVQELRDVAALTGVAFE
jgi:LDH2 family malate/lactate/ureidoglycolate dehydrogenase